MDKLPVIKAASANTGRLAWLEKAYQILISAGVEAIKIQPLAKAMQTSRTSFYWFFKDRDDLLANLLDSWQQKNTLGLIAQTERYAQSIVEATLNVFDCWLDASLFDADFEFAVRSWALHSPEVAERIKAEDAKRTEALTAMFVRFGYEPHNANVRARTIYLTQVGYISMKQQESIAERISRVAEYIEIFTGKPCNREDLERFASRHSSQPFVPPRVFFEAS